MKSKNLIDNSILLIDKPLYSQHIYFSSITNQLMAEEVNNLASDNNSNNVPFVESKIRSNYLQITITLGLIIGPILFPFILIWPNWFSLIPSLLEISIFVTILFIMGSGLAAYSRDKQNEK